MRISQEHFIIDYWRSVQRMPKKNIIKILEKYGIPSSRTGGLEYIVASNLMIYEELKKLNTKSMLDY